MNASLSTRELQALDSAHFIHPFTDTKALAAKGARIISKAEGIWITDREGHRILDGMSGLWCVNVGYGRTELADAAHRQMAELPYYNSFFQTTTEPSILLAAKLAELSPGFSRVFFSGSGSEGNDTVLRLVRHYWSVMGQPKRSTIISRWNAYHGSTVAGASLGGMKYMHEQGGLPIPGIAHIDQPYWVEHGHGMDREAFGKLAASWLEDKILELGPENVGAFIGEPVQGAGGVIIPPASYWTEIERICRKYDILIVADEVICGFGRLGSWWGSQRMGFKPDLMTFAKGVTSGYFPLGGVMVGDRVGEAIVEKGGEFEHGYTYSGHPVACAVALANLDIIEREGLVQRVAEVTGPRLRKGFAALADHPLVAEPEALGFVAGLVLAKEKGGPADGPGFVPFAPELGVGMVCRQHCFDNGLVMRAVGDRMIVAPPLCMTEDEVDELLRRIRYCLDRTYEDVRARGWC
ncbi:aspartate aminotransferase family protein [Derxia gummosa]|uniref:Aspartate aminotransferase family protein n=1 Tax=Derxia gummosa DSM 723 TaxID=1121388 RepID=A0A8B6X2K6_9BURK|nr:aspartate aminotransferase family protein [Derxia gummosa]